MTYPEHDQACDGDTGCTARVHVHGCYADLGRCDHPHEHSIVDRARAELAALDANDGAGWAELRSILGTDGPTPTPAGDDQQREALADILALAYSDDDAAFVGPRDEAAADKVLAYLAARPSAPTPVGDGDREALARRLYEAARHTGNRIAHGAEPWEHVPDRGREPWYAVADAARPSAPTATTEQTTVLTRLADTFEAESGACEERAAYATEGDESAREEGAAGAWQQAANDLRATLATR